MKKLVKKLLALGLAGATICGVLASCAPGTDTSSPDSPSDAQSSAGGSQAGDDAQTGEKKKVVLWHLWTGAEAGYVDEAVAAYNEQSDLYEVESVSTPDSQKITVAIQAGTGPDITDGFTTILAATRPRAS